MPSERLQVILEMVTGQYKREAREAASATGQITKEAGNAQSATGGLSQTVTGFGSVAKAAFAGVAVAAVGKFAADTIDSASRLEESLNAVEVVFGNASNRINEFGAQAAESVGLAQSEFNELATGTGALLTNFGFTLGDAADETITLTTRAADMASVFNTDVSDALSAIQAGLRGETEPLRRFGVSLDDATVRAKAVELGLADTTASVDKHGKAVASLQLIYDQTNKVAGDFENTSDSLANTQRRFNAVLEDAKAEIGQALLPAMSQLVEIGIDLVPVFKEVATGIVSIVEELSPLIEGLGWLIQKYTEFKNTSEELAESDNPFVRFAGQLGQIVTSGALPGLIRLFDDAVVSQEELTEATNDAQRQFREHERTTAALAEETEKARKPVDGLAEDAARLRDRLTEATAAQRAMRQAFLEAADPAFAAAAAIRRLNDAQERLEELQKSGTASAEEIAQAELELAQAALEAQGAIDEFDASGIEAAISTIATALGVSRERAQELLEELGLLDGTRVSVFVDINQGRVSVPNSIIGGITERQHGGPARRGEPLLVGEAGPEVFIPDSNGVIIPNNALEPAHHRTTAGTVTGGGFQNLHVYYPHTGEDLTAAVQKADTLHALTQAADGKFR